MTTLLFLAGVACIACGAGLISIPAGIIAAGAGLIALALILARGGGPDGDHDNT